MKKRFVSILLAFCLLCALLPVSVFAENLTNANVLGLPELEAGMCAGELLAKLHVPSDADYTLSEAYIHNDLYGYPLSDDDFLELGQKYSLCVKLLPKSGYSFGSSISKITCMFDGDSTKVDSYYSGIDDSGRVFFWTYSDFVQLNVDVQGFQDLTVGKTSKEILSSLRVADDACYTIDAAYVHNDSSSYHLADNDVLELGQEYSLCVKLLPKNGFSFGTVENLNLINCMFNGDSSKVDSYYTGIDEDTGVLFFWTYSDFVQLNVDVQGLQDLTIGKTSKEILSSLRVADDACYTIDTAFVHNDSSSYHLVDNDVLESGQKYSLCVKLLPKDGFSFGPEENLNLINCMFNGDPSKVDPYYTGINEDTGVLFFWTDSNYAQIGIDVQGYQEPKAGYRSDFLIANLRAPADADYTVIDAYLLNEENRYPLDPDDVLVEGQSYSLSVTLHPKHNDSFPKDLDTFLCTLNGTSSLVDSRYTGFKSTELFFWSVPITAHTWDSWKILKPSTASSYGTRSRTCKECGITETQMIPYLNPFVDLKTDYYYIPVLWAAANKITSGTDATHFAPTASCTRAQVVTFLWRAAGCPEPASLACSFQDVKSSDYFYKAVVWAKENQIVNGVNNTTFKPNSIVTRKDFVTFLWRLAGKPKPESMSGPYVDITNSSDYFYQAVLWGAENGIVYGTNSTHFSPNAYCTRAQVVTFLYRYFGE